ncbi:MAG: hypothetical protein AVO38_14010 [delta proteobacterium ML8_D]|nr:MAG: hypothetical protein AVO38_14010 [delta proteobacterium ML8_D]
MKKSLLLLMALAFTASLPAQEREIPEKQKMHFEVPDARSEYSRPEKAETSPAYKFTGSGIFTTQVNVNADGNNILYDAANEPSIAVDPTNPDRMMMGWRQFDDVSSSFRQAGYGYSSDGGQSWTFPGSIQPGAFRSDPVLDVDADGCFYYNSLSVTSSDDFFCTVFKTGSDGFEWDNGTFAHGGDKQWMRIDRSGGAGTGHNYSFWTKFYSWCHPGFFTRSSNLGISYEPCIQVTGTPYWGTLAIGPEGELYIVGGGNDDDIMIIRSDNAQVPGSTIEWLDYSAVDLGGYVWGWSPVNPQGLLGQVWVDVDVSDGPGRGNVYVLASVVHPPNDPADVMFARSTDGGLSWDPPQRINDDPDPGRYQWFGTMSVAPNGRIDATWLDTRVDPSNGYQSALFYSFSVDQGLTWSVNEQLSPAFDPHLGWPQQEKMGDYFHMVSDDGGAHLAWCNTLNGEQDVYYSYITPTGVGAGEITAGREFAGLTAAPNPFAQKTRLRYTVGAQAHVRLAVFDIYGKELEVLVDRVQAAGSYILWFDGVELPAGVYLARLSTGSRHESLRLVRTGFGR